MFHIHPRLAKLMLLCVALIWGTSLSAAKIAQSSCGVNQILAVRFLGAGLLALILFWSRIRKASFQSLSRGLLAGICLYTSYGCQTWSLLYTTPSKSTILNATYCILVPILGWILFRSQLEKRNRIAALLCLIGVIVVGGVSPRQWIEGMDWKMLMGDGIALLSGLLFAAYVLVLGSNQNDDPLVSATIQFWTAGLLSALFALFTERLHAPLTFSVIACLAYLSLICTLGALIMQNVGQRFCPADEASLVLSTESIFGVIAPVVLGLETLHLSSVIGVIIILLAIAISERFIRLPQSWTVSRKKI